MSTSARPRLGLAVFVALWFLPGLAASAWLLDAFRMPWTGVLLHAALLLALLLSLLLPFMPELLRNSISRFARGLLAVALSSTQVLLLLFYGLSALGQRNWGNWMNWELLLAYGRQLPDLMAALDVPMAWLLPLLLGLALLWVLLFLAYRRLLDRALCPCLGRARDQSPRLGLGVLLLQLLLIAACQQSYSLQPQLWWREPIRQARMNDGFGEAGMGQMLDPAQLQLEREAVRDYRPGPAPQPRPLVLILVDALRSDQMQVYGGPTPNTPFLSRLHSEGRLQRIDHAYSVCTVSYCGILGTLSSRYWHQITPQPWNLADALQRAGYESRFLLSGDHTSYYGMRKMYGPAVALMRDGSDTPDQYSNDDQVLLNTLDQTGWPSDKPGFMYLHLMSAHRLGRVAPEHKLWQASNAPAWSAFEPIRVVEESPREQEANARARARYHNGIRQADAMIEQIFARLERFKVLEKALVIISSDHGEYLGEHGHWSHGGLPLEPAVRIPLLVYDRQARQPLPEHELVSQVDIAPTLLRAAGLAAPRHWAGLPLQDAGSSHQALVLESAESSGLVALVDGRRYKYLRLLGSGKERLHALDGSARNPRQGMGEAHNLAAEPANAALLLQLRQIHQRMTGTSTQAPTLNP
ncbi:sulfatase family protein [Roseateles sp.]|uniref:sulfatase family protein n=1 Tax=Roseateles sp. TaxID=1971397 RepID=UPI003D0B3D96